MKKLLNLLLAIVTAAATVLPAQSVLAATASVYLTPASGGVVVGASLTVDVRENSGAEPVNAASVNLTYPSDKFDFVSINNSSAFNVAASGSGGGGTVSISRGANPAVSGDQSIATVSLKAKVSSGTGDVSFSSAQVISANSNTNITGSTSGGTYTFQAVPSPPSGGGSTPSSGGSTSSTSSTSHSTTVKTVAGTSKDTIAPTIRSLQISDIKATSAVVSWITSEPANSQISYGLDQNYGLSATDNSLVTNHSLTLNAADIRPQTLYHLMVKSADAAGNTTSSGDTTFTTQGVGLSVSVTDQNNKAVAGAKVSILRQSAKTDKNGTATLSNLPLGKQQLSISFRGKTTTQDVVIGLPDATGQAQSVSIQIEVPSISWTSYGLKALLVLIAAGIVFLLWRRFKKRPPMHPIVTAPRTFTPSGPPAAPTPPPATPASSPPGGQVINPQQ